MDSYLEKQSYSSGIFMFGPSPANQANCRKGTTASEVCAELSRGDEVSPASEVHSSQLPL